MTDFILGIAIFCVISAGIFAWALKQAEEKFKDGY